MRVQLLPILIGVLCCACDDAAPAEDGAQSTVEAGVMRADAAVPDASSADAAGITAADAARQEGSAAVDGGPGLDAGSSPSAWDAGASGPDASAVPDAAADAAGPKPISVGHPHRFIASVHGGGADKLVY